MTVNFQHSKNRIYVSGDVVFGAHFGDVCSVFGVSFRGGGHEPHVHVGFIGGLSLDLDPAAAIELARRLPEALAGLPHMPDVSGSVWDGTE